MEKERSPRPVGERNTEQKELGHDTSVRITFLRHSQKEPGKVADGGRRGITTKGVIRAKNVGEKIFRGRNIKMAYGTKVDRTAATLQAAFEGAGVTGMDKKILQTKDGMNAFFDLPHPGFDAESEKKMNLEMDEYVRAQYPEHPGKTYRQLVEEGVLSADDQEEIEERFQEKYVQWYLDLVGEQPTPDRSLPRQDAASVAYKINRLINLPDHMKKGESVDLVSSGHKYSTEGFLKYCIEREVNGKKVVGFNRLEDIGGSMKVLDGWDLVISNDASGKKNIKLVIRRENGEEKEYGLNVEMVSKLAGEYMQDKNITQKRIDFPILR